MATFEECLNNDMSEYIGEYFYYGYQSVNDGYTLVSLVDKDSGDPILFLYYDYDGYIVSNSNMDTIYKTTSYKKLVKYLNSLKWEV